MTDSPPPSPASILRAQLIVEKAKLANAKAKKAKKNSATPATTKVTTKKAAAARSKKAVNKERVEDGQEAVYPLSKYSKTISLSMLSSHHKGSVVAVLQMPGCVSNPVGFEAASNPKMKLGLLNQSKLNRFETSKSKPKQRLRSRRFVYFEFPNIVDKLSETGVIIHHVVKISPCFYKRSNPQLFLGGML